MFNMVKKHKLVILAYVVILVLAISFGFTVTKVFAYTKTTLGTNTGYGDSVEFSAHNKIILYSNYWYWFYYCGNADSSGSGWRYSVSDDLITWSGNRTTPANVTNLGGASYSPGTSNRHMSLDVFCDNSTGEIYLGFGIEGEGMGFVRGLASSLTHIIAWDAYRTLEYDGYYNVGNQIIKTTEDKLIAVYQDYTSNHLHSRTSIDEGNTWAAEVTIDTPTISASTGGLDLEALNNGDALLMYKKNDDTLQSYRYDGASWSGAVSLSATLNNGFGFFCLKGSLSAYAYLVYAESDEDLILRRYNNTAIAWSNNIDIDDGVGTSHPTLEYDAGTNIAYIFWAGCPTTDHVYYRSYCFTNSSLQSRVNYIDETTDDLFDPYKALNAPRLVENYELILIYTTKTISPYKLNIVFNDIEPPTPPIVLEIDPMYTQWIGTGLFLSGFIMFGLPIIVISYKARERTLSIRTLILLLTVVLVGFFLLISIGDLI